MNELIMKRIGPPPPDNTPLHTTLEKIEALGDGRGEDGPEGSVADRSVRQAAASATSKSTPAATDKSTEP